MENSKTNLINAMVFTNLKDFYENKNVEKVWEDSLESPVGTDLHDIYLDIIKEKLSEEDRYSEYVVCFNSGITNQIGKKFKRLFHAYPIRKALEKTVVEEPYASGPGMSLMQEKVITRPMTFETQSIPEYFGDELLLLPRSEVEYNKKYKQLCVGVILKKDDKYVLLQNTENHRLAHKITMIQGHVDYSPEIYIMSMGDYLKRTILKELSEEIEGVELDPNSLELSCLINDKFGDLISFEHVGMVFVMDLGDADLDKIVSKEPEKHSVIIKSIDEIDKEHMDRWLALVLEELNK